MRQVSRRLAMRAWAMGVVATSTSCSRAQNPPTTSSSATTRVEVQVTGSADPARRRAYRDHLLAGVAPVRAVWGPRSVRGPVLAEAPATSREFGEFTGSGDPRIPALTRPDGRIVIHPNLWDRTTKNGRQVVMSHELTHVALGQGAWAAVPRWVVEGSAEFTAYRATELTPARVAPGLARQVRAGDLPDGPPTDAEVGGEGGYGLAWAWCCFLVSRSGTEKFTEFVQAVGRAPTSTGTQSAFRAVYGTTPERLAQHYSTWLASWV